MYNQERNQLRSWFFSPANIDRIQSSIHNETKAKTGISIGRQNDSDLIAIMNSVYSVNSWNPYGEYDNQINFMNSRVTEKAVSQVKTGLLSYKMYLNDLNSVPIPADLPVNTSSYGRKIGTNNKW